MTYLSLGENFYSMKSKFGGNPDFFGTAVKWVIQFIYCNFYNKISGDLLRFYSDDDYRHFARLICAKTILSSTEIAKFEKGEIGSYNRINLNPDKFRIIGFIDDTNILSCRVGSCGGKKDAKRHDKTEHGNDLQKAFYR